jgi:cytochrome c biogenesis protein CcmG/thiol:disulfide interchange protein DsbE
VQTKFIISIIGLFTVAACSALPGFLDSPAPEVGAAAPDFTLKDLSGASISLGDLRDDIVVLNFWATWCGPCRLEMPMIQESYNDGEFAVLAINFDESIDKVQGFVNEMGLSFPILLDPGGKIQELYRVRGYPSTYFVDADGVIQFIHIGEMSKANLDRYLVQIGGQP